MGVAETLDEGPAAEAGRLVAEGTAGVVDKTAPPTADDDDWAIASGDRSQSATSCFFASMVIDGEQRC